MLIKELIQAVFYSCYSVRSLYWLHQLNSRRDRFHEAPEPMLFDCIRHSLAVLPVVDVELAARASCSGALEMMVLASSDTHM